MYGHVERPISWARHLLVLRDLQAETGGITEFVPLPFVHMEAPMYLRGQARKGPTLREAVLMHAVARLALHPLITNIQTSWVKMGPDGAALCLNAGANDLGGTLMNESISRAAGTQHGQEFPPEAMEALIRSIGRMPVQRDTLYRPASQRAAGGLVRRAGAGAGGADAAAQGAGGGVALSAGRGDPAKEFSNTARLKRCKVRLAMTQVDTLQICVSRVRDSGSSEHAVGHFRPRTRMCLDWQLRARCCVLSQTERRMED